MTHRIISFSLFILFIIITIENAYGYIGPGAGFAFISSFFILFLTGILAFLTLLTWPVRAIIVLFKRRKISEKSKVRKVVVLGFDGLDPDLTQRFISEGKLPGFENLRNQGCFRPLRTTTPSISPVAWSTFSTGVNPGKHRIFDFFTRDTRNYLPILSSAQITNTKRFFKIGPFKIPRKGVQTSFLRKSISFWKILGKHGIFSSVLRVPITFPPEKFYGSSLSAMCTPDLLGTQGTFTLFTTRKKTFSKQPTGGMRTSIQVKDGLFKSRIMGPSINANGSERSLGIAIEGQIDYKKRRVHLKVGDAALELIEGKYSPWVRLEYKAGIWKRIRGIARFLVMEMKPHLEIYMTPINIDPEKPALPISHPLYYSVVLSKLYGPYATLGLAEDTWALNEGVIDEGAFLKQSYDIFEERKRHLLDALKTRKDGLVVTVFDTTDRIQHMFYRYLTPKHPANKGKDTIRFKDAIENVYEKMDIFVGEIQQVLRKDDLLIIISDHGFKPFKWGINLNTWLWKNGYLVLKEGKKPEAEWFANVDWQKTRAYANGLSGIFLNVLGREGQGIIHPVNERPALQQEIRRKLEALWDEENKLHPIRRVIPAQEALKGPYTSEAPDLFIGYEEGYRASWNSAIGKITNDVLEENTRRWSGDHCIDPDLVPGVFFSNWALEDESPHIGDIAPTILHLFGVEKRSFHDGKILKMQNPNGSP